MSDFTEVERDNLLTGSAIETKWFELASGEDADDFVRGKVVKATSMEISVLDTANNFYAIATGNTTATHAECYVSGTFKFEGLVIPSGIELNDLFDYARAKQIILVEGV